MATRTRHSLAQRANCITSCDVPEIRRSTSAPASAHQNSSNAPPRTTPDITGSQEPQINLSAIQGFLLSALPLPVFAEHIAAMGLTDPNESPRDRRDRSCWKLRVISSAQADSGIPGSSGSAGQRSATGGNPKGDPAEDSSFKNENGRGLKIAKKLLSPSRP